LTDTEIFHSNDQTETGAQTVFTTLEKKKWEGVYGGKKGEGKRKKRKNGNGKN
jgi:hypothetical protein